MPLILSMMDYIEWAVKVAEEEGIETIVILERC